MSSFRALVKFTYDEILKASRAVLGTEWIPIVVIVIVTLLH